MALDNYTRGQKIAIATLIVLLAATFTVSAAMIALAEGAGRGAPPEGASVDGKGIRYADYVRLRRALGIVAALDGAAYRSSDNLETIYARVPALSPRDVDGYMWGNANSPVMINLLHIWPMWQDQRMFCHLELVRRAREAGVEPPSNVRVGEILMALINADRGEADKIERGIEREFRKIFQEELSEMLPILRECVMVREYVESRLAEKGATLEEIALISAGDSEEARAQLARLSIDAFMDRARAEVIRENNAWQASRLVGGLGVSTLGMGYDALEEAFDRNRHTSLQQDARFSFDVLTAYPDRMLAEDKVSLTSQDARTDRIEMTYLAMRDEMFKASGDSGDIEKRLTDAANRYALRNPDATRDWTEEKEWKEWKAKQRPDMEKYMSLEEVRADLERSLKARNAVPAARDAITGLLRVLDDEKKTRERELNAELEVARKELAVIQGVKDYLVSLRQRFTTLEEQVWVKITPIAGRVGTNPDHDGLSRLADELARALIALDSEQLSALQSAAALTGQDLARQVGDRRAQLEEFRSRKDPRNEQELLMTPREIELKIAAMQQEVDALTERIRVRDEKMPVVEGFITGMRAMLAQYELAARQVGQQGDVKLRLVALNQMLVDVPAAITRLVKDSREGIAGKGGIIAQSEVDDWEGRVQLKQADLDSRTASVRKDAADTRSLALSELAARNNLTMSSHGDATRMLTWNDVMADESLRYLDLVDGAKSFLEEASNTAGMVSSILTLPGKGYLLLRLRDKAPKHAQGRADAHERTVKLAAMQRARRLTIDALSDIRRDAIDRGWDAAVKSAAEKYGAHFSTVDTGWFTDRMDIPGVYSEGDNDLLSFSSSPSAGAPDQPLITRLKEVSAREGVSKLLADKHNPDPQRRPDHELWAYMFGRIVERRPVERRMQESALKETGWGGSPGELWRYRHLAGSELVHELITPAALLKDKEIILYKPDEGPADNAGDNKE